LQPTGSDREPRTREELLGDVYGRARQLWWRRRVLPGFASVLVLLALAMVPVVTRAGEDHRTVAAVNQPPESTTTFAEPTTTTEVAPVPAVAPTTPPPTTAKPRPTTTTTAPVCRNSYDPRCGPFRWDPDPGPNAPSTVQITYTPTNPRVGDAVKFTVTYSNPDGPATSDESKITWGNNEGGTSIAASQTPPPGGCKAPYGPWTPPPRTPDTVSSDWPGTHTYKAAGTYTVTASGSKGIDSCVGPDNPYRDEKTGSVTITVSP